MSATTEVTGRATAIPGLLVFDVTRVGDERGYFQEKYQREKLVAAGLPPDFTVVQNNISFNQTAGATRGLHAEPWEKYLSIVTGKAFCAWVDLRKGDSFGKVVTQIVDPLTTVFVPRGIANGYQALEPDTYYSYLVSAHWSADAKYQSLNMFDPDLAIDWPIKLDQAVVSDKDKANPLLKDVTPMEF